MLLRAPILLIVVWLNVRAGAAACSDKLAWCTCYKGVHKDCQAIAWSHMHACSSCDHDAYDLRGKIHTRECFKVRLLLSIYHCPCLRVFQSEPVCLLYHWSCDSNLWQQLVTWVLLRHRHWTVTWLRWMSCCQSKIGLNCLTWSSRTWPARTREKCNMVFIAVYM